MEKDILKNWFSKGKKPTGEQFATLIDSMASVEELNTLIQSLSNGEIGGMTQEEQEALEQLQDMFIVDTENNLLKIKADTGDTYVSSITKLEAPKSPIFATTTTEHITTENSIDIKITQQTEGSDVYYTIDGADPKNGTKATLVNGVATIQLPVSKTKASTIYQVKVISKKNGLWSLSSTKEYITKRKLSIPIISVGGTDYDKTRTVTITHTEQGVTIYYTTDGTAPSTSSNIYQGQMSLTDDWEDITIKAIAVCSDWVTSEVHSQTKMFGFPITKFGFISANSITAENIVAFTGSKSTKTLPAQISATNDTTGKYLWLCVPRTLSVSLTDCKSGGFQFGWKSPVTVGNYKCYRSYNDSGLSSGEWIIDLK